MSGSLSGARATADKAFMWGLLLFLGAGLVQIFLAGVGVFGMHGRELEDATSFDPHRTLGFAMGGLALLLLILAAVARASGRTVVVMVVVVLLANLVQSLLAAGGGNAAFFGGLHALDGLVILGLAGFLFGEARQRSESSTPAPPASSTGDA